MFKIVTAVQIKNTGESRPPRDHFTGCVTIVFASNQLKFQKEKIFAYIEYPLPAF